MKTVDLSKFENKWYNPGSVFKRTVWYLVNLIFFKTSFPVPSRLKTMFLKIFGSEIGKNIVIKPNVNIKYPWFLDMGSNIWIGEGVWIDNIGKVVIGNNVCISQGVYLLTANHNYKMSTFDLIVDEIVLEDAVWIGAKSIICPGVRCRTHSVLTSGSVATKDMEPYKIYQGNPAVYKRDRVIEG